ncbi:MAG: hydroxylase, partial [Dehalococcoidia bacterium]
MTTVTGIEPPLEAIERLAPLIREHADASEREATLAAPVVVALRDAAIFRQTVPASLGGAEVDPITWYRTVEAASRIDGSTGWVLFINGSTGIHGRNMSAEAAEPFMRDPATIVSGAVFPFAKAVASEGGAFVTGRSPYASGCKHATHVVVFAVLHDGDVPRMTPFGPDLRMA